MAIGRWFGCNDCPCACRTGFEFNYFTVGNMDVDRHSVIVDAVLARESERAGINEVAARLNVRFVGLFLVADLATRLKRVGVRKNDAPDQNSWMLSASQNATCLPCSCCAVCGLGVLPARRRCPPA